MATIEVKYDTSSKRMTCALDGVELGNIAGAYFGRREYDGLDTCELYQHEQVDGYHKFTRIVAAESPEGQALVSAGLTATDGWVFVQQEDQAALAKELLEYFGKDSGTK